MNLKPKEVAKVSAIVFGIVGVAHLLRILYQLKVVAGSFEIPLWVSGPIVLFAGWLGLENWKVHKKR